jgi:hypothetical protein
MLIVTHKATCNIRSSYTMIRTYGKSFCTTNEESWILVNFTENKKGIKNTWLFRIKERDEL